MIITCSNCSVSYNLNETLLKRKGSKVSCCICEFVFIAYPPVYSYCSTAKEKFRVGVASEFKEINEQGSTLQNYGPNLEFEAIEELLLVFDLPELEVEHIDFDEHSPDLENIDSGLQNDQFTLELQSDETQGTVSDSVKGENIHGNIPSTAELTLIDEEDEEFDIQEGFVYEDKAQAFEPETNDDEIAEDLSYEKKAQMRKAVVIQEHLPLDFERGFFKKRIHHAIPNMLIYGLSVFVFICISGYVAGMMTGYDMPFIQGAVSQFFHPAPARSNLPSMEVALDEESVNGRFVTNISVGNLFVITGKVVNSSSIPVNHILIKGTLSTKGNIKTITKNIYCGNILSDQALKTETIVHINEMLMRTKGLNNNNFNVQPNAEVPFMVVFSDLPDGLDNLKVEVLKFDRGKE